VQFLRCSLSFSLSTSAAVSSLNEKMRNFDDGDEDDDDSDDSEGEFADEGDWYASLIARGTSRRVVRCHRRRDETTEE